MYHVHNLVNLKAKLINVTLITAQPTARNSKYDVKVDSPRHISSKLLVTTNEPINISSIGVMPAS